MRLKGKKRSMAIVVVAIAVVMAFAPSAALAAESSQDPLLNLQMNFMDQNSIALAGYIITIDNEYQSVTNSQGVAKFPAIHANGEDTFRVFTPDKKQVGICNLEYEQSGTTGVGTTQTDGTYTIYYSTIDATIYIDMIADPNGGSSTLCHPAKASDTPLPPGATPTPTPTPTATATASATSTATPTPKPTDATNPELRGYLVDGDMAAIYNATVQSKNDESGMSYTATTDAQGYYSIPGITEGEHTISVFTDDNKEIGAQELYVKVGSATNLADVDGDEELEVQAGASIVYMNMQATGDTLRILDVSDQELMSPAVTPTPEPSESATAEPTPTPTAEEPTPTEAAPTPTPEPAPQDNALGIIVVVAIIAAAAVIIVAIVVRSKRRGG